MKVNYDGQDNMFQLVEWKRNPNDGWWDKQLGPYSLIRIFLKIRLPKGLKIIVARDVKNDNRRVDVK